jgi:hypothetical protein
VKTPRTTTRLFFGAPTVGQWISESPQQNQQKILLKKFNKKVRKRQVGLLLPLCAHNMVPRAVFQSALASCQDFRQQLEPKHVQNNGKFLIHIP